MKKSNMVLIQALMSVAACLVAAMPTFAEESPANTTGSEPEQVQGEAKADPSGRSSPVVLSEEQIRLDLEDCLKNAPGSIFIIECEDEAFEARKRLPPREAASGGDSARLNDCLENTMITFHDECYEKFGPTEGQAEGVALRPEQPAVAVAAAATEVSSSYNSGPSLHRGFLRFNVGSVTVEDSSGPLTNGEGGLAWGMGGTINPLSWQENICWDFDYIGIYRTYDNNTSVGGGPFVSVDDKIDIDTNALLFGLRAYYPAKGQARAYVMGGGGFYRNELSIDGSLFGIPGTVEEDTDSSLGFQVGFGVDFGTDDLNNWRISLNFKRVFIDADFDVLGGGSVDLGGFYFSFGIAFNMKQ